jgi:hypothetical protein
MATPILEEVAYHAWISKHAYAAVAEQLHRLTDSEANHIVNNAFVRSFRVLASKSKQKSFWESYINQYRGTTERDYGQIQNILRDEYGFSLLPDAPEEYVTFAQKVSKFLEAKGGEDFNYKIHDKAKRDGFLIASVLASRTAARQAGLKAGTIVLSSARSMKDADAVFRNDLGRPDAVMSTAAIGCLLTLAPGVHMGLGTLRGVLFDMGLHSRLSPIQRYAYQLIVHSREYSVPWSRRVTLEAELGARLLADAKATGEPLEEIRKRVIKSEDPEYSAKVVSDALSKMAVTPEAEREVEQLRTEVAKLREELDKQKRRK